MQLVNTNNLNHIALQFQRKWIIHWFWRLNDKSKNLWNLRKKNMKRISLKFTKENYKENGGFVASPLCIRYLGDQFNVEYKEVRPTRWYHGTFCKFEVVRKWVSKGAIFPEPLIASVDMVEKHYTCRELRSNFF